MVHATKLFKKDGDILLSCKAYNSRVVLEWLADATRAASGAHSDFDPRFILIVAALFLD